MLEIILVSSNIFAEYIVGMVGIFFPKEVLSHNFPPKSIRISWKWIVLISIFIFMKKNLNNFYPCQIEVFCNFEENSIKKRKSIMVHFF